MDRYVMFAELRIEMADNLEAWFNCIALFAEYFQEFAYMTDEDLLEYIAWEISETIPYDEDFAIAQQIFDLIRDIAE